VAADGPFETTVGAIADAGTWNERVQLVRAVPANYGLAQHTAVYSTIAQRVYVPHLTPDFAYIHWREEYDLPAVVKAYDLAHTLSGGFSKVDVDSLAEVIQAEPSTLRIFRLLLGFTTQEFAASTTIPADALGVPALTNGNVKSMESGRPAPKNGATLAATVVDKAIRSELFPAPEGEVRSKINKPDTVKGWETVRGYAKEGVPFPVFLHQRYYGGAFRQLLDATSSKRGNLLEDAVEGLFTDNGIKFIRTGTANHAVIEQKFGLTVRPAPDFIVHDAQGSLKAMLECKLVNDGGTARDKASRFSDLRRESVRLGGAPLFAVLNGLGWRRTADALGPVVRDCDGRVFTVATLEEMLEVEPFPGLRTKKL
jgi:hypothetical protein